MFLVLRGGCAARHPYPFSLSREQGMPNYVLLFVRTAGNFCINGTETAARPGHAVLICPKTPYYYRSPDSEYMDDWLHFEYSPDTGADGAKARTEHPKFPPMNQLFLTHDTGIYSSLLRQLLWEKSYSPPAHLAENTDALFRVLFNHLNFDYSHPQAALPVVPYQEQLRMIRLNLKNSPEQGHDAARYAAGLGISESYFQHIYRRLFGIPFQKDCIRLRVAHAMELLDSTDLTAEHIYSICGYHSEVHFYRQFKSVTGCTPMQYRRRILRSMP